MAKQKQWLLSLGSGIVYDETFQQHIPHSTYRCLRRLEDATAIQNTATQMPGEYTGANRVGYAEVRPEDGKVAVTRNYTNGVPSLEGVYSYEDYGKELYIGLSAERIVVRPDVAGDPWLTPEEKQAHEVLQLRATVNVPFRKAGQLVAILFVHYS